MKSRLARRRHRRDSVFHPISKNRLASSRSRRLGLEPLEERLLLNAALGIGDVSFDPEGEGLTRNAAFTVGLTEAVAEPVTVLYSTSDGSATEILDYVGVSGMLTFPPQETSMPIEVPVFGDTLDEYDESFFVNLWGAENATIADGQGECTIVDDDPEVEIRIGDASVIEHDTEPEHAIFTVSLEEPSGKPVTVDYSTYDGSAVSGNDYVPVGGSLSFTPGQTSNLITVLVNGDKERESNETFFVDLALATHAIIDVDEGRGTRLDLRRRRVRLHGRRQIGAGRDRRRAIISVDR